MSKIIISGVQNAGKTTFIDNNYKFKDSKSIVIKEEVKEIVRKYKINYNETGTVISQSLIFFKMYDNFLNLKKKYETIIKDRGLFDAYIYTLYVLKEDANSPIAKELINFMKSKVLEEIEYYDKLVLFTIDTFNLEIVDNGFRSTNKEYREEINQMFIDNFNELFKNNPKCVIATKENLKQIKELKTTKKDLQEALTNAIKEIKERDERIEELEDELSDTKGELEEEREEDYIGDFYLQNNKARDLVDDITEMVKEMKGADNPKDFFNLFDDLKDTLNDLPNDYFAINNEE